MRNETRDLVSRGQYENDYAPILAACLVRVACYTPAVLSLAVPVRMGLREGKAQRQ